MAAGPESRAVRPMHDRTAGHPRMGRHARPETARPSGCAPHARRRARSQARRSSSWAGVAPRSLRAARSASRRTERRPTSRTRPRAGAASADPGDGPAPAGHRPGGARATRSGDCCPGPRAGGHGWLPSPPTSSVGRAVSHPVSTEWAWRTPSRRGRERAANGHGQRLRRVTVGGREVAAPAQCRSIDDGRHIEGIHDVPDDPGLPCSRCAQRAG